MGAAALPSRRRGRDAVEVLCLFSVSAGGTGLLVQQSRQPSSALRAGPAANGKGRPHLPSAGSLSRLAKATTKR